MEGGERGLLTSISCAGSGHQRSATPPHCCAKAKAKVRVTMVVVVVIVIVVLVVMSIISIGEREGGGEGGGTSSGEYLPLAMPALVVTWKGGGGVTKGGAHAHTGVVNTRIYIYTMSYDFIDMYHCQQLNICVHVRG